MWLSKRMLYMNYIASPAENIISYKEDAHILLPWSTDRMIKFVCNQNIKAESYDLNPTYGKIFLNVFCLQYWKFYIYLHNLFLKNSCNGCHLKVLIAGSTLTFFTAEGILFNLGLLYLLVSVSLLFIHSAS